MSKPPVYESYPDLNHREVDCLLDHYGRRFTPEDILAADRRVLLMIPNFGRKSVAHALEWAEANKGRSEFPNVSGRFTDLVAETVGAGEGADTFGKLLDALWEYVPPGRRHDAVVHLRTILDEAKAPSAP